MSGALDGLVLIEVAERVCGEYAGKLLADLGATVIKVEQPGGAPTRHLGPFHQGTSTLFQYLNTSKQSVVIDLAADRAALDALLAGAHGLIDDHAPQWCRDHQMTQGDLAETHPHLVHCLITPFGQSAPDEWQIARPINVINAGGWAWHSPSETTPDKPPLKGAGRFLSDYEAGIDAAIAMLASLRRQRILTPLPFRGGAGGGVSHAGTTPPPTPSPEGEGRNGQFIDISEQAVQINRIDCVLDRMLAGDVEPSHSRTAYDMGGPGTSFACKDGHIYIFMTTKAHWTALVALMGDPEWARQLREDWLEFDCTPANVAVFRKHFTLWIAGQEKLPITEAAQKAGIAMVPVNTALDLPRHEQFRHRGFFQEVDGVAYPTVPYKLSKTPARVEREAPGLGAEQEIMERVSAFPSGEGLGWGLSAEAELAGKSPPPTPPLKGRGDAASNRHGPLAGIRVLAFTKVWAGPYTGKLLAALGAQVIKVESATNLDEMRAYGGVDINAAPYFLSINQEVLSVQVNTKTAEGLDLVRQMVAKSDIVIDNIRPGAMERSKLGYDELKAIKPDIIQLTLKMWGNDGPLGYQTGYAPCFAALSGLTALVGHEGETPKGMNIRYGDSTAGAGAALAVLAALHHRDRTGEGQFIDLSAVETMTSLIGDSLFAHAVTGEVPQPDGNYHPEMCPHGAYPCQEGEWLSLAIADDHEWQALRVELDLPDEENWADLAGRQQARHTLDAAIGAATARHDVSDLAERLRQRGVPAFRSMSSMALCADDFLWASGTFRMVSDHRNGSRPIIGPSWRMEPDEAAIERGAPLLGEHNAYVYRELLGLSQAELDDLVARKVVD